MQNTALSLSSVHPIPVRVKYLQNMCEVPEFDPFTAQPDHLSGIECTFREIRRKPPKGPIRITIYLA